ncbi:uncharacterized protein LOC135838925 [Planococcus citri]|uniref:uncharacterized protein LOC135838925 n=1 Tax=Planococcus citri TaxID=170843 RepID=UPI0031F89E9A
MDPIDQEIRRRLDKLKEDRPPIPSEEELRLKLQKLKGETPSALSNKYVLLPCVKSNEEQINDLMKQYSEEAAMGQRLTTPIHDIEQRLNNLKMFQVSGDNNSSQSEKNTSTSRESSRKIPTMIADEDESMECSDSHPQEYFCYICDRVPKWICYTCDDQLFCPACYKEFHEDEDEPHRRKPFNVKKKYHDSDSD